MKCPECHGRGTENCSSCTGGKVSETVGGWGYRTRMVSCYNCGGHWRNAMECSKCNGTGHIDAQYDRVVFVQNCYSRQNLDLKDWDERNGATLQDWNFTKEANQQWHIQPVEQYSQVARIASVVNGKFITAAKDNVIVMWENYTDESIQQWRFTRLDDNSYTIQSIQTDLYLDLSRSGREPGVNVVLQPRRDGSALAQRWFLHNYQTY